MRVLALALGGAFAIAGPISPAQADIYRWTDAEGRVHFTQDLSQVPPAARGEAERSARAESPPSAPPASAAPGARPGASRRALQIPFEKQGSGMLVMVRLNDSVTAPFLVDTGASDVVVPAHFAAAAGIRVSRDTPRQTYQTANGLVESPIVTLTSVEVGDVRVENVRGSLTEGIAVGLLGGTFFNNFTFQVDPGANVITLHPNAQVRGGANAEEWRARFRAVRNDLAALDAHLSGGPLLDEGRARALAERRAALVAELEALDHEANAAGVPQAWRD